MARSRSGSQWYGAISASRLRERRWSTAPGPAIIDGTSWRTGNAMKGSYQRDTMPPSSVDYGGPPSSARLNMYVRRAATFTADAGFRRTPRPTVGQTHTVRSGTGLATHRLLAAKKSKSPLFFSNMFAFLVGKRHYSDKPPPRSRELAPEAYGDIRWLCGAMAAETPCKCWTYIA